MAGAWAREYAEGRAAQVEQQRISNLLRLTEAPMMSSAERKRAAAEAARALGVADETTDAEGALEETRRELAWFVGIRRDLVDSLAYVDEATDPRTLAARVIAALKGDPEWESVEVE